MRILLALVPIGAGLLIAQGPQSAGRGYAWGDRNRDGICDFTGRPVGQGRGARGGWGCGRQGGCRGQCQCQQGCRRCGAGAGAGVQSGGPQKGVEQQKAPGK